MRVRKLAAMALLIAAISSAGAGVSTAALSPLDAVAALARQLSAAIAVFPSTSAVSSIEAQLALIVEQSGASNDAVLAAIDLAEAAPGISTNARQALEELKRLIVKSKRRNRVGALGDQGGPSFGSAGPAFVGGGGSDYHN